MSEAVEAVLRGAGLTDKPGEFDSSIHSWRCEHPETYGPCDCFQELVRELAEVERAAAARALREFAQHLIESAMPEHGSHINMTPYREGLVDGVNRAVAAAGRRAAEYRQERGEQ